MRDGLRLVITAASFVAIVSTVLCCGKVFGASPQWEQALQFLVFGGTVEPSPGSEFERSRALPFQAEGWSLPQLSATHDDSWLGELIESWPDEARETCRRVLRLGNGPSAGQAVKLTYRIQDIDREGRPVGTATTVRGIVLKDRWILDMSPHSPMSDLRWCDGRECFVVDRSSGLGRKRRAEEADRRAFPLWQLASGFGKHVEEFGRAVAEPSEVGSITYRLFSAILPAETRGVFRLSDPQESGHSLSVKYDPSHGGLTELRRIEPDDRLILSIKCDDYLKSGSLLVPRRVEFTYDIYELRRRVVECDVAEVTEVEAIEAFASLLHDMDRWVLFDDPFPTPLEVGERISRDGMTPQHAMELAILAAQRRRSVEAIGYLDQAQPDLDNLQGSRSLRTHLAQGRGQFKARAAAIFAEVDGLVHDVNQGRLDPIHAISRLNQFSQFIDISFARELSTVPVAARLRLKRALETRRDHEHIMPLWWHGLAVDLSRLSQRIADDDSKSLRTAHIWAVRECILSAPLGSQQVGVEIPSNGALDWAARVRHEKLEQALHYARSDLSKSDPSLDSGQYTPFEPPIDSELNTFARGQNSDSSEALLEWMMATDRYTYCREIVTNWVLKNAEGDGADSLSDERVASIDAVKGLLFSQKTERLSATTTRRAAGTDWTLPLVDAALFPLQREPLAPTSQYQRNQTWDNWPTSLLTNASVRTSLAKHGVSVAPTHVKDVLNDSPHFFRVLEQIDVPSQSYDRFTMMLDDAHFSLQGFNRILGQDFLSSLFTHVGNDGRKALWSRLFGSPPRAAVLRLLTDSVRMSEFEDEELLAAIWDALADAPWVETRHDLDGVHPSQAMPILNTLFERTVLWRAMVASANPEAADAKSTDYGLTIRRAVGRELADRLSPLRSRIAPQIAPWVTLWQLHLLRIGKCEDDVSPIAEQLAAEFRESVERVSQGDVQRRTLLDKQIEAVLRLAERRQTPASCAPILTDLHCMQPDESPWLFALLKILLWEGDESSLFNLCRQWHARDPHYRNRVIAVDYLMLLAGHRTRDSETFLARLSGSETNARIPPGLHKWIKAATSYDPSGREEASEPPIENDQAVMEPADRILSELFRPVSPVRLGKLDGERAYLALQLAVEHCEEDATGARYREYAEQLERCLAEQKSEELRLYYILFRLRQLCWATISDQQKLKGASGDEARRLLDELIHVDIAPDLRYPAAHWIFSLTDIGMSTKERLSTALANARRHPTLGGLIHVGYSLDGIEDLRVALLKQIRDNLKAGGCERFMVTQYLLPLLRDYAPEGHREAFLADALTEALTVVSRGSQYQADNVVAHCIAELRASERAELAEKAISNAASAIDDQQLRERAQRWLQVARLERARALWDSRSEVNFSYLTALTSVEAELHRSSDEWQRSDSLFVLDKLCDRGWQLRVPSLKDDIMRIAVPVAERSVAQGELGMHQMVTTVAKRFHLPNDLSLALDFVERLFSVQPANLRSTNRDVWAWHQDWLVPTLGELSDERPAGEKLEQLVREEFRYFLTLHQPRDESPWIALWCSDYWRKRLFAYYDEFSKSPEATKIDSERAATVFLTSPETAGIVIPLLQELRERRELSVDGLEMLADLLVEEGRFADVVAVCSEALEKDVDNHQMLLRRADAHLRMLDDETPPDFEMLRVRRRVSEFGGRSGRRMRVVDYYQELVKIAQSVGNESAVQWAKHQVAIRQDGVLSEQRPMVRFDF